MLRRSLEAGAGIVSPSQYHRVKSRLEARGARTLTVDAGQVTIQEILSLEDQEARLL